MKRILLLLLVIGGVGAAGTAYYRTRSTGQPASKFRLSKVIQGDLRSIITATGTIEPQEVINVGAQVAGRIQDFGVDGEAEKKLPPKSGIAGGSPTKTPESAPSETGIQAPSPATTPASGTGQRRRVPAVGQKAAESRPRIDYGSVVHVGTELAYIDETRYLAQVEQAQASLDRAMADLGQLEAKRVQASAALARAEQLRRFEQVRPVSTDTRLVAISDTDYDLAVANDKVAKANLAVGHAGVQQARATLAQAQTDLDYTVIQSPVEGVIIDRRVNIGQTVVAALNAPSLFLIAKDLSRLQVWASVNEADIGKIHAGMKVRFSVDAYPAQTFEGRVKQIRLNAQMQQNVVLYTVVVETANPDGRLLPYLTANLEFEVEQFNKVLLVPNSALRWIPQPQQIAPSNDKAKKSGNEGGKKAEKGKQPGDAKGPEHGRIWVTEGDLVRSIDVEIGANDGINTIVSGPEVHEGLVIVTGEETNVSASGEESTNPFGPPKFMKGRQKKSS
jgi:HlyD family secretion protein